MFYRKPPRSKRFKTKFINTVMYQYTVVYDTKLNKEHYSNRFTLGGGMMAYKECERLNRLEDMKESKHYT